MSMDEALQKHAFENAEIVKLVLDHSEQAAEKHPYIPVLGILSLIKAMKHMLSQHNSVDEEVVRLLGMSFVEMLQRPIDTVNVRDQTNEDDEAAAPGSFETSSPTLQAQSVDDAADMDTTPCPQPRPLSRVIKRKRAHEKSDGQSSNKRTRHSESQFIPESDSLRESVSGQEQILLLRQDTVQSQAQAESPIASAAVHMPQLTGLQTPNLSDDETENVVEEESVVAEMIYELSDAASESDNDGCFVPNCSEVTIPDVRCFGGCERRAHNRCLANRILGKHDWGTCKAC